MKSQSTRILPPPLPRWKINIRLNTVDTLKGVIAKTRKLRIITILTSLLFILGGLIATIIIVRREAELSRMKTNFVSAVSHEMRLPLTTIRMICEMYCLGKVTNAKIMDRYMTIMEQESNRLGRLVDKVLDFSRMDSGRKPYELTQCNISPLLREAVNKFQAQLKPSQNIQLDNDTELPPIKVDTDGFQQIVFNLLENAVKYSPEDSLIKVRSYFVDNFVAVDFIDQGIGINPSAISKIFNNFYRAENEMTRERSGTGLGLSIVKHIIDAHYGYIKVKSVEGGGSEFSIMFPIVSGEEEKLT